jgi:hypothetical protein
MSRMKAAHEEAVTALETNSSVKLVAEYEKYQTLEAHARKLSEEYERYDCRISCRSQHFCYISSKEFHNFFKVSINIFIVRLFDIHLKASGTITYNSGQMST